MNLSKTLLAVFAGLVVLTSVAGSAVAVTNTWYLDNHNSLSDTGWQNVVPPTDDNEAVVNEKEVRMWSADAPAGIHAAFPVGGYPWSLELRKAFTGSFQICVGTATNSNSVASFIQGGCTTVSGPLAIGVHTGVIPSATGFDVFPGEYFAVLINNLDNNFGNQPPSTAGLKFVAQDADSYVQTPLNGPPYPTPELGTMLLAGAGLAVVGAIVLRRK